MTASHVVGLANTRAAEFNVKRHAVAADAKSLGTRPRAFGLFYDATFRSLCGRVVSKQTDDKTYIAETFTVGARRNCRTCETLLAMRPHTPK